MPSEESPRQLFIHQLVAVALFELRQEGLSTYVMHVECARLLVSTVSSFLWAGHRGALTPAGPFLLSSILIID
jgi:hypothetical protein